MKESIIQINGRTAKGHASEGLSAGTCIFTNLRTSINHRISLYRNDIVDAILKHLFVSANYKNLQLNSRSGIQGWNPYMEFVSTLIIK
ncbi:MAG TPA: hypothetical protein VFJ51_12670 [Nitrososphaeraceae archaeon]|nr:hypothetical protein [Nitrososphaeraceae archaeon]